MGFYSFTAFATNQVLLSDPIIQIGRGVNVFTATTDDIEGLKELLTSRGVTIQKVTRLDDHKPVGLDSVLLPEERQALALESSHAHTDEAEAIEGSGEDAGD